MATRRTRIKGIANIPHKRKAEAEPAKTSVQEVLNVTEKRETQENNDAIKIKSPKIPSVENNVNTVIASDESSNKCQVPAVSTANEHFVQVQQEPSKKSSDFNIGVQRKYRRTEPAKKIAQARMNFIAKFGNNEPEKDELTMIDLLFYNPATKPMSHKFDQPYSKKPIEMSAKSDAIESDEDGDNPAPQIKIGSHGAIVVNEESLFIENKKTRKDRKKLQNSDIINGDIDTSHGTYKCRSRTKGWTRDDTLLFYKTLNTLGTDFALMTNLFPERSRRELKMKFKREERINHALIDKALTKPISFTVQELKEEIVMYDKIKKWEKMEKLEKLKEMKAQKGNTIPPYACRGMQKAQRSKMKIIDDSKGKDIYSRIEKGIASVWGSDSEEETTKL